MLAPLNALPLMASSRNFTLNISDLLTFSDATTPVVVPFSTAILNLCKRRIDNHLFCNNLNSSTFVYLIYFMVLILRVGFLPLNFIQIGLKSIYFFQL